MLATEKGYKTTKVEDGIQLRLDFLLAAAIGTPP